MDESARITGFRCAIAASGNRSGDCVQSDLFDEIISSTRGERTDPRARTRRREKKKGKPRAEQQRFWSVHSPSSRPFVTQADGPVKARFAPAADNGNRPSRLPIKSVFAVIVADPFASGAPHARAGDACSKDIVCGQATCRPSESVITPSRHKPQSPLASCRHLTSVTSSGGQQRPPADTSVTWACGLRPAQRPTSVAST